MKLREMLLALCSTVYFQPPSKDKMKYPCIIYEKDVPDAKFADNGLYYYYERYTVTYIDKNPDTEVPYQIAALPMCIQTDKRTMDGFYHYLFKIYC